MRLRERFYKFYRYRLFPKIKDFRGATRASMVLRKIAAFGIESIDENTESIFEKGEWDNLILIDACRHDLYCEVNGEVESRISKGSTTTEYIEKTFSEGDFSDIVYIAANPYFADDFLEKLIGDSDKFHAKYDVFDTDWDSEEGTVLPASVTQKALSARKLFPDKKLIIHFIQPHYPFINTEFENVKFSSEEDWLEGTVTSVWDLAEAGQIRQSEIKEAYKRNLEYAMTYVESLMDDLEGETVITSDHGNLVGENGLYGHPGGSKAVALRKVPWDRRS